MAMTFDATYENGVFVPVQRPELADHERVRITVEPAVNGGPDRAQIQRRRGSRIRLDPELAKEIAESAEFGSDEN